MVLIFSPWLFFCDIWDLEYFFTSIHRTYHSSWVERNTLNLRSSKFSISILFEEAKTEKSGSSQSNVSNLDNVFFRMQCESSSSPEQVVDDHTWSVGSECVFNLPRILWHKSYDNPTFLWKYRETFSPCCSVGKSETWSERTFNKSNDTQAGGSQARRKGRIYEQCWQTVHWLLCEGKGRTIKRNEQCSSKESKNFLFCLL